MAGTSAQWNNYNYLNAQKNIFTFENVHEMDNGQKMESMGGNTTEWSLFSYMARVNYDYMNRYLVTATIRRDGSSRFGRSHRWGTFPSVSLAWRLTEENGTSLTVFFLILRYVPVTARRVVRPAWATMAI